MSAVASVSHPAAAHTWFEANQRVLCAELARIRKLLCSSGAEPTPVYDGATSSTAGDTEADMPRPAAIDTIAVRFGLTPFERDVLLLAAGVEMDGEIARYCASTTAVGATFAMALASLPGAHWSAVSASRPLRRWHLVSVDGVPVTRCPLSIEERVLHYLVGVDAGDPRLACFLRRRLPPALIAASHRDAADRIARAWLKARGRPPVLLVGDDPDGQEDVAACAAAMCGLALHVISLEDLPSSASERRLVASLWSREAALVESALLIDTGSSAPDRTVADFVEAVASPTFVTSRGLVALRGDSLRFAIGRPDADERRRMWRSVLGPAANRAEADIQFVGDHFSVSARTIGRIGVAVHRGVRAGEEPGACLRAACRTASRTTIADLAERVEAAASWDDLVLPDESLTTLREIAAHVRHRGTVYRTWLLGATCSRGLGIAALFTGEPGTGKTLAAEVLARDLGLDLYRVDLSRVVSKYIGETEKNLRRVFDAAENGGAILLFDEADALFGKRSEVKDSHDRYANIEVSYLLQRMETYDGLAILTTNLKSALDRAFQRRLRFVVPFPFPGLPQRERLWRQVFPTATPLAALDYAKLARLNVAGGTIRNIAVHAAFHAAQAGTPVTMEQLARAARSEYTKQDRTLLDSDIEDWR